MSQKGQRRIEFEAYWDGEAWCARAIRHSIYTFADTLDELFERVKEAATLYVQEEPEAEAEVDVIMRVRAHVPEVATGSS